MGQSHFAWCFFSEAKTSFWIYWRHQVDPPRVVLLLSCPGVKLESTNHFDHSLLLIGWFCFFYLIRKIMENTQLYFDLIIMSVSGEDPKAGILDAFNMTGHTCILTLPACIRRSNNHIYIQCCHTGMPCHGHGTWHPTLSNYTDTGLPCWDGLVVSVFTSLLVGPGFAPRPGHIKDHHKNGTNCLVARHTEEFDGAAPLSKSPGSV